MAKINKYNSNLKRHGFYKEFSGQSIHFMNGFPDGYVERNIECLNIVKGYYKNRKDYGVELLNSDRQRFFKQGKKFGEGLTWQK